ncbi:MAG TPA: methyltransferase [Streptosporangiaceae bacterium]|nr:methyltransferase [Streptosporangiaceae bacterium]
MNLAGAASAALFAHANILFYLQTHRLIGGAFFVEQAWFAVAFLIRRPPRTVSRHVGSWLLAAGGTFGGLLFRPAGVHLEWGVQSGLVLQLLGLVLAVTSLAALGRSFGFVPASRGVATRGPYAVIRHPLYAAYVLIQCGYLLQAVSWRNVAVLAFATGCNIGRSIAEEGVLGGSAEYADYRRRVRWRLLPGLW